MHIFTETITRTAIDISGRLGSLYNGWRDQILGVLDISTMKTSIIRNQSVLCKIQRCETNESPNLARMIGIEDELRLSALLNFVSNIGISSIIDYPHSINKYTRCFRYHYLDHKEHLFNDPNQVEKSKETLLSDSSATHIITEISLGIDIVVILQLPPDDKLANDIDAALEKIRDHLQNSSKIMIIASDVERLFDRILFTTVYSNIFKLVQMNKFLDLCRNLNQFKKNPIDCELLRYRLSPIKWFFPEYTGEVIRYSPLESELRDIFESDLLQSSIVLKQTCSRLDENTRRLLQKHLASQLLEAHRLYSQGKVYHEDVVRRLQSLIVTIRSGQEISADIAQIFRDEPYIIWRKTIDDLNMYTSHLQSKANMINELQRLRFEYCNALDRGIQDSDDQTIIEQKLGRYEQPQRFLCSTDILNNTNPSQWNYLRNQLIRERNGNEKIRLIYVDFSYCTFKLAETVILDSSLTPPSSPRTSTQSASLLPSSTLDIINILLLGESGVGKSTFINALMNYLTFKSLKQALSSNPIVLIPVSFPLRISDTLDERVVKFDLIGSSSNENHNHPGHSVTQHSLHMLVQQKQDNGFKNIH
ncbi:unnamed protein product [Rotaria sp. Silwood2]|nr:unnamed protein product [Rotaria sp. Silwood2]CAF4267283.1 unnamed protein product [Rotaria sp. Silwood2]CAF4419672.1 unnamed protein product [Rotaria sp. Silwood2]